MSRLRDFDVEFSSPLGCGTFGAVYAGKHRKTRLDVAIKLVSTECAVTKHNLEREHLLDCVAHERLVFQHILACGETHANVVDLIAYFEGDGQETQQLGLDLPSEATRSPLHYFVMERLRGPSLQEHIEQKEGLEESEARSIAKAVCHGLEFLHRQGIVHRDIKPANLMFSHDLSSLKLIDFSHAGLLAPGMSAETACFDKKLGTPGYIAPEVLLQTEPYNTKCDIFSFGCVVHAMLCNLRLPRRHPRIGILTSWPDGLSRQGRVILDACLSLDPADRPSASEILQDAWLCHV